MRRKLVKFCIEQDRPSQQQIRPPSALHACLYAHWGVDEFRPLQLEAVQATLQRRDVLLLLATGGGKSVAYQLPALSRDQAGFSVIVSPLLALAKDQVESCLERGIDAAAWNSLLSEDRRAALASDLVASEPSTRLLYTTPEALRTDALLSVLQEAYQAGTLVSLAVDEAHCVSQWGHDFRKAYLSLSTWRTTFPNVPIIAVTATATTAVREDMVRTLRLCDPLVLCGTFNRPNIAYEVCYKELLSEKRDDTAVLEVSGGGALPDLLFPTFLLYYLTADMPPDTCPNTGPDDLAAASSGPVGHRVLRTQGSGRLGGKGAAGGRRGCRSLPRGQGQPHSSCCAAGLERGGCRL